MRIPRLRPLPAAPDLGFGAAQLGNLFRETTDDQAAAALDAAWDAGVRYYDTAPHYGLGLSERRVGRALASRPRDEYLLSTKAGRLIVPDPANAGGRDDQGYDVPADLRREWDFSRDGIRRSLDESLTRLGLDRVDIVYLHDPDDHWAAASTTGIDALVELRDEGVIGAIGAGMNQSAMLAEFIRRCDIDLVMLAGRYTLLDREAADELLPLALERGVGVIAAGVYNSGLLSRARVASGAVFDYAPVPDDVRARAEALADTCERHGIELPAAALQFPARHPAIVATVVGLRTAEQVAETMTRWQQAIPDELWSELA
jgi:D-threo-aldose 1-dehydrogenase